VVAARAGDIRLIKFLLAKGADPNLAATYDWSPLGMAAFAYHCDAAEALVQAGAKVNLPDAVLPPLESAIAGVTLNDKGPRGRSRWKLVRYLVDHGADVHDRSREGEPPIFSTMDGQSPNAADMLGYLLEHGAKIDEQYPYIGTALHRAAELQDVATVEYVVSKGADIQARNEHGETPIFMAVREGRPDVRSCLLRHGASLADRDNLGETPLFAAVRTIDKDRVQWCIDHGADVSASNKQGRTPLALLLSFKVEGVSTDGDGMFTEEKFEAVKKVLLAAEQKLSRGPRPY
jgi:ankyrin repeat protein